MDYSVIIQLVVIGVIVTIISFVYFKQKKEFNMEFLFFQISAILSGGAIYAGIMWLIKPLNLLTDVTVYESPLYNVLVGFVLILFSVIALKNEIKKLES